MISYIIMWLHIIMWCVWYNLYIIYNIYYNLKKRHCCQDNQYIAPHSGTHPWFQHFRSTGRQLSMSSRPIELAPPCLKIKRLNLGTGEIGQWLKCLLLFQIIGMQFSTPHSDIPKPLASPAPQYLKLSVWIPQIPAMHAENRHT